jgi:hypothetical protein
VPLDELAVLHQRAQHRLRLRVREPVSDQRERIPPREDANRMLQRTRPVDAPPARVAGNPVQQPAAAGLGVARLARERVALCQTHHRLPTREFPHILHPARDIDAPIVNRLRGGVRPVLAKQVIALPAGRVVQLHGVAKQRPRAAPQGVRLLQQSFPLRRRDRLRTGRERVSDALQGRRGRVLGVVASPSRVGRLFGQWRHPLAHRPHKARRDLPRRHRPQPPQFPTQ